MAHARVKYCPNCGTAFTPPQKYCMECGQRLMAPEQSEKTAQRENASAPEPQRERPLRHTAATPRSAASVQTLLWLTRGGLVLAWLALGLAVFYRFSVWVLALYLVAAFMSRTSLRRYEHAIGTVKRGYRRMRRIQRRLFFGLLILVAALLLFDVAVRGSRTSFAYAFSTLHWPALSAIEMIKRLLALATGSIQTF